MFGLPRLFGFALFGFAQHPCVRNHGFYAEPCEKARTRGDKIAEQVEDVVRNNKVLGNKTPNKIWNAGINWDEKISKVYRFDSVKSATQGMGRQI